MDSARPGRRLQWGSLVLALVCFACGSGDSGGVRNASDGGEDAMDASAGQGGQGGEGGRGGSGSGGGGTGDEKDAGACDEDGGCDDAGPSCGNSMIDPSLGEQCDDGNADSLDGCSANCEVESDFACGLPGEECVTTVVCGDGFITGNELCDDHNTDAGDGCSATCQIESGWACPLVGAGCQAAECGDGIIVGFEACDDGDGSVGDGCSEDCQLEHGYACPTPNQSCVPIVCGDSVAQGLEQCDDGGFDTGDGCSPACEREPVCMDGSCLARCGDGLKLASEACDDGNQLNGDGCSSSCTIEPGFTCQIIVENPVLPIVYRDFIGTNDEDESGAYPGNTGPLHQDFEKYNGCEPQVEDALDIDGKPVLENRNRVGGDCVDSIASFGQWYRSDDAVNFTIVDQLAFQAVDQNGEPIMNPGPDDDRFEFEDPAFFPLTGAGWNSPADLKEVSRADDEDMLRNFHFTSEVRYWFTYRGGEKLTFFGDDDVWVFINRHLAVDIAGVHSRRQRDIVLPGPNGANPAASSSGDANTYGFPDPVALDIDIDGTYEVVVYQAERHTEKSQYQLTLENFLSARSVCAPVCGDGIVTRNEVCDDGPDGNDGEYGHCLPNCQGWGPRCGDDTVQADEGEDCDNGINLSPYGLDACAPGCKTPAYCGDGNIDSLFGEACDDEDNDGGYDECAEGCMLGERCGDGEIQADHDEECDDGNREGGDGCNPICINEAPD